MFLFTLSKIVTSTCASDRPLKVVDEDLLEPLPGVDRVVAEALQPRERCRVLVTAEPCGESWKTIAAFSTLYLGYFAVSAPGIDYGSRIASFVDSLAQVFWRVRVIGQSRVASKRWLLR
jgi:hypothetical protein